MAGEKCLEGAAFGSNFLLVPHPFNLILVQHIKIQIGEISVKEINLRKYYPNYTHDAMVKVPDEVAELLELTRAEGAQRIRTYRHKAMYSLELINEIREFPAEGPLPEEILEQSNMRELLYRGLQSLPEKQRSRLIAYYFLGMSKAEIAHAEGSEETSVRKSIQRGLTSLKKFFEEI